MPHAAAPTLTSVIPSFAAAADLRPDRFPGGLHSTLHRIDTETMTSIVSDYGRDHPVSGELHCERFHYFDFSLSGRPKGALGRFPDAFSELERVGKLLFIPACHRYQGHGGKGRQRNLMVFFRALGRFDDDPLFGKKLNPALRDCVHLQGRPVVDLMLRIGHETRHPGIASGLVLEGLGLTLLGETARLLCGIRTARPDKGGLAAWRLKLIEERIRGEGSQSTIHELATLCGMSRRNLIRAFRQQTGQTIGSFAQKVTIERARQLLTASDESIKRVAAKLGFSSSAAFATAFRRSCGVTPREFRTHHLGCVSS